MKINIYGLSAFFVLLAGAGIVHESFRLEQVAKRADFEYSVLSDSAMGRHRLDMNTAKLTREIEAREARLAKIGRKAMTSQQSNEVARLIITGADKSLAHDEIMKIIKEESGWDPSAENSLGYVGLMGLHPKWTGVPRERLLNPVENVRVGIPYLKKIIALVGRDGLAFAAYNQGPNTAAIQYAKRIVEK